MIKIELTEEEAEVLDNYIFKKICKLEESNLTDSLCYSKLLSIHHKLNRGK